MDPLTIGLALTALAAVPTSVAVYRKLKKPSAAAPVPTLPSPERAASEEAAEQAKLKQTADLIVEAAKQQWLHEASHKAPYDARQRQRAAMQRATRALHTAQLPLPADLPERVAAALAALRGVPHA